MTERFGSAELPGSVMPSQALCASLSSLCRLRDISLRPEGVCQRESQGPDLYVLPLTLGEVALRSNDGEGKPAVGREPPQPFHPRAVGSSISAAE